MTLVGDRTGDVCPSFPYPDPDVWDDLNRLLGRSDPPISDRSEGIDLGHEVRTGREALRTESRGSPRGDAQG